jgi:hypothetical protein
MAWRKLEVVGTLGPPHGTGVVRAMQLATITTANPVVNRQYGNCLRNRGLHEIKNLWRITSDDCPGHGRIVNRKRCLMLIMGVRQ